MVMKLYAHPDRYQTHTILVCAKLAGLEIEVPNANSAEQTGKIPVLETPQGCVFTSTAIARYISRINRVVGLYGQNLIEGGAIDSWLELCTHELEVPLAAWVFPLLGIMEEVPEATAAAKEDVDRTLTVLNNHLLHNTYMVGNHTTLADISLYCALVDGFRLCLDEKIRKRFPNVMRWFNLMTLQPEIKAIVGEVKFCGAAAKVGGAKPADNNSKPKSDPKPKTEPKPTKEDKPKKQDKPKEEKPQKENKKKEDKPKEEKPKEDDPEAARKALLKKVLKEGGKRGVEIEGAADMGGLQFFCTSVDLPDGDVDLTVECVKAMNTKSDPTEEERKGGSGRIGKMVFSAGVEQLAVVAYVPPEKQGECDSKEWLEKVLGLFGGSVTKSEPGLSCGIVKANPDKGVFPLKIRETLILEANNYLRGKGLFPEDNGDSDDEMVFGDDDFPS